MPYTLKPNKIFAKDPNSDGYLPQNVVTDASTADQVSAIQTAGAQQVAAVEEKGEETLASIPEDYTELSGEVGDLKSAFAAKLPTPPTTDGTYVLTVTVTAGDPAYSWVSTGT